MSLKLKTAAAVVLVAVLSTPAFAATAPLSATLENGGKSDVIPVTELTSMIGVWAATDLSMFDKAKSIKVLDTRNLYQTADLKTIATAEAGKSEDVGKIRTAIKGDAAFEAWFTKNKLDVDRVIAVSVPMNGTPEIVLY